MSGDLNSPNKALTSRRSCKQV